jgi:hypothetical protein
MFGQSVTRIIQLHVLFNQDDSTQNNTIENIVYPEIAYHCPKVLNQ